MKVAIIVPTMNRPDFMLRQLEFYEQVCSPHPVYISDSSNPENAEKLKNSLAKFKNFKIVYQWAPSGKDYTFKLLSLVGEKYCLTTNDDDLMIPQTISECAEFLESHSDYGTCAGKQINFHFREEDFNKPYGAIEHQTRPLGVSNEDENMLKRVKNFWSKPNMPIIVFTVRKTETERAIRDTTKYFSLTEDMFEFLLFNMLLISGKSKILDKLGYVMQRSIVRFFDHRLTEDFTQISAQWEICENKFSDFVCQKGVSREESLRMIKWMFIVYLTHQYSSVEASWLSGGQKTPKSVKRSLFKRIKYFASQWPFLKSVYYRWNFPDDVTRPESKYFNDFKIVKDFLEKNR